MATLEIRLRLRGLARSLAKAGVFLEVVVILSAIGGLLAGLGIATRSQTDPVTSRTTHPYVALGIGIMGGALVAGVLYWALARALRLFAEYAAFRAGTNDEAY